MDYVRDYAMYASIFGMFSFSWFGWAQENPRSSWRKYIGVASGVSLLICLIGVYLSVTNWDAPSVLNDKTSFDNYLISVYVELFLAGAGASILMKCKYNDYVAPWISFIVGIHFIGLKSVFNDFSLYLLAALLVAISIVSLFISKKLKVANSAITGIGAGTVLFAFALLGLIRYLLS
ncbi:hypothetical protein M2444_002073 [Paenibacillus sp. PastF-3]|uniref:hypothetical protein n=1 Tax=unclassified Paenibacillus TaxID=185978 RepID=UPI000BA0BB1B|nr:MULTISPECIES: hypothetical protein [unclassified Paenibacillus]MDH6370293.1 hypothetical protein [Paenibacillus sp. PastF-3]OZQ98225.1 hypothetical protein CA598_01165 [Paenibacillus sp. VTT E-133291]